MLFPLSLYQRLGRVFLFAVLLIFHDAATAAEQDNSNEKISAQLQELQLRAGKFPSFKVKFEQQVFSSLRKKTNRSEGELTFSKPRKFRWEISKPNREVYANNGEWFWKYVERTKHAVRLPANSGELDFLDVIFQLDNLKNKYKLKPIANITDVDNTTSIKCPANHVCIDLVPIQTGSQKNIHLAIDRANGFVSAVSIAFRNGNRTLIRFSSFNEEKVTAESFEFTPPAGTAIDKR
jgi:outer membrane lipoprotein carrier protein